MIDTRHWLRASALLPVLAVYHTAAAEKTYDPGAVNGYGYAALFVAALFVEVLRRCGDDLTRAHLMEVATHLNGVHPPMLLPGINVNTSPSDFAPMKQLRQQRFDGREWRLLRSVVEQ